MSALPHRLDRTVVIRASREIVFSFFTDSDRWASWWGAGSTVGTRPGEPIYIRHPGGVEAAGEIVEVEPPTRIVFTYGFVSGNPIPPGASLATITLQPEGAHTRLHLVHEFADAATRDHHIQGWRYQLSVFANAVADDLHRDVNTMVDAWFSGWAEIDDTARERMLGAVSRPNITFHDRHSAIDGLADLTAHIGAYHTFMPNVTLARRGDVRHCQGVVLADSDHAAGRGGTLDARRHRGAALALAHVRYRAPPGTPGPHRSRRPARVHRVTPNPVPENEHVLLIDPKLYNTFFISR